MYIDQISVFVENKTGRLAGIMEVLNKAGIDIRAMTIADTADFGILRMIVDDTDKAIEALKADGCTAAVTKVIAFTIPDVSGALYNVMGKIHDCGINVEYMYSVWVRWQAERILLYALKMLKRYQRCLSTTA